MASRASATEQRASLSGIASSAVSASAGSWFQESAIRQRSKSGGDPAACTTPRVTPGLLRTRSRARARALERNSRDIFDTPSSRSHGLGTEYRRQNVIGHAKSSRPMAGPSSQQGNPPEPLNRLHRIASSLRCLARDFTGEALRPVRGLRSTGTDARRALRPDLPARGEAARRRVAAGKRRRVPRRRPR